MTSVLTNPYFYLAAIPAVMIMGLSKGGFAGIGALALPVLALVVPPVTAAGILLPILVLQDVVGVVAYRRTFDRGILAMMLPAAAIGIGLGYLLAARVNATVLLAVVGLLSILFAAYRLWLGRGGKLVAPAKSPAALGLFLGVASGFASQVAHAGQPPFQIWVLPKRLSPTMLAGTTAVFFAAVNWLKVPAYIALGQFSTTNLMAAAVLAPIATAATFGGLWLVKRVQTERFYTIIYLLMIGVGVQLLWEALARR